MFFNAKCSYGNIVEDLHHRDIREHNRLHDDTNIQLWLLFLLIKA